MVVDPKFFAPGLCIVCGKEYASSTFTTSNICPSCIAEESADRIQWATQWALHTPSADPDPVNHSKHYTKHPSGIECIQITEHMGFNLGNAVKYIWRADLKGNAIEDLEKARWYLDREIARRKGGVS
ncbi:DUF3310 domain-containing protein [uncultured Martelella sp.]|uniref:DUF3310 domain-containing protein n=1 Tax=uncultured Martelella sp. TaxID=392331 RepID=UPI0029C77A79|nr:DUF3310 domain-containing protein [uncultured Martelella sp.]